MGHPIFFFEVCGGDPTMERRFEFGGGGGLLVSGWVTLSSNYGRIFMVEDIPVGKLELGNITNDWP
jgi:hypothetical protein